jgi:hypothetical protein
MYGDVGMSQGVGWRKVECGVEFHIELALKHLEEGRVLSIEILFRLVRSCIRMLRRL